MLSDIFSTIYALMRNPSRTVGRGAIRIVKGNVMYVGKDYDNIEAGETDIFSIDFTGDLPNGRAITSASFTCSVVTTDPGATPDMSPSSRIIGAASVTQVTNPITQSTKIYVNQKAGNMVVGNRYALEAVASTNDGCTIKRYSRVYCTPIR